MEWIECPKCKAKEIYVIASTSSTMSTGWIRCCECNHIFQLYYSCKNERSANEDKNERTICQAV